MNKFEKKGKLNLKKIKFFNYLDLYKFSDTKFILINILIINRLHYW